MSKTLYLVKQVYADADWFNEPAWCLIPWTPELRESLRQVRELVRPLCSREQEPRCTDAHFREYSAMFFRRDELPLWEDPEENKRFVERLIDYDRQEDLYETFLIGMPSPQYIAGRAGDYSGLWMTADEHGFRWTVCQDWGSHPLEADAEGCSWDLLDRWGEVRVWPVEMIVQVLAEDQADEERQRAEAERIIARDKEEGLSQ